MNRQDTTPRRSPSRLLGVLAVGGLAFVGAPAWAQAEKEPGPAEKPEKPAPKPADKPAGDKPADKPKTDKDDKDTVTGESLATSKFIEAYTTGDWEKAEKTFNELTETFPAYRKDPQFVYKYASALSKIGSAKKNQDAAEQLQGLLEQDPDHILAMYLLAKIRASQTDKPQAKEDAKDLLLNAARNGFYAIRAVQDAKTKEFEYLRNDPKFILKVMRASQEFQAGTQKNVRNPFTLPRFDKNASGGTGTAEQGVDPKVLANLETSIDTLFADIEKIIREKEIDKLAPLFGRLNDIMAEYKTVGKERVLAKLKTWERKLDEWKEVRLAIQLQVYISEGNELLRAMLRSKQAEKFEEVFEQFNQVKGLVDRMRHEEREEFHRNADAIQVRAKTINDDAIKLKKIKEFNLTVTGIVIDPRPESRNKAIILFEDPEKRGRIYEESEEIRTEDGRKPGLKVVKISEGTVRFRYEDTEFTRELKTPS